MGHLWEESGKYQEVLKLNGLEVKWDVSGVEVGVRELYLQQKEYTLLTLSLFQLYLNMNHTN